MNAIRFRDRLRCVVDNAFSKGAIALIAWLGILSLVIVISAAVILTLSGINMAGAEGRLPFIEAFWLSLMRTLDAGTMGNQTAIGYRLERYAHDAQRAYGVALNPAKSQSIAFSVHDRIIVLAND